MTDPHWLDDEPPASPITIGRWSISLAGDELTDIAVDGVPVLRSVRTVARDDAWATVPVTVLERRERSDGFSLRLAMLGLGAEISADLDVAADQGQLAISLLATMGTTFSSNRTGLVVLHDQALAGTDVGVRHDDGTVTTTRFPSHIAPHQPATDIGGLSWASGGLAVSMSFAGAVFEMEDQRNWCDASFKTYSGRLRDPYPVRYSRGDVVSQSVTIRVAEAPTTPTTCAREPLPDRVSSEGAHGVFPQIQLGATTAPDPVPLALELPCSAVLVEVDAASAGRRDALERARAEARGLPLDVRIAAGSAAEAIGMLRILDTLDGVRRVGVVDRVTHVTTPELWGALAGFDAQLTAGTRGHFAQLNRGIRELPPDAPTLTFSITPQVHARERRQLIESIAAQRRVVDDAIALAGGRSLDIGPVTLRPRITIDLPGEPDAHGDTATGYGAEFVPGSTDPRQDAPALAAWTIASAAALARPGVRSITWFEASGPRGIRDERGVEWPVALAVRALHALTGLPSVPAMSRLPPGVHAVAAGHPGRVVTLLANLTPERVAVNVDAAAVVLAPWSAVRHMNGVSTPLLPNVG